MSWPPRASNYRRQETFKEYELRSVFVSQVRGREGKTGEKLTFPRILVVGTTVYGVPCFDFADN